MLSIYELKPKFQNFLHPALAFLVARGVTPNMLTMAALIGSMSNGCLLLLARTHPSWLLMMPLWLLVRMALNALDGMMAREFGMATAPGAVLNEVGDVLSDLALYLPLAFVQPSAALPIVLFCVAALLTEFCGVLAQALGGARRYDGPMGKSDRAFWVAAVLVVSVVFPGVLAAWTWLFSGGALCCAWTCERRLRSLLSEHSQCTLHEKGGEDYGTL